VATPSIPESITARLQVKLFLRSTHALTKARREARSGYVTREGFWEDPPGYVDEVVWPNYAREHAWMFEDGDVDRGEVKQAAVRRQSVVVGPGYGEKGVGELLEWSLGVLEREIAEHVEIQLESGTRLTPG
jgi:nicotinamide/nicotinate riboside kinase